MQNRNGVIYTDRLPEIVAALQPFAGTWIHDGEIIFLDKDGKESFTGCQRRCGTKYFDPWLAKQYPVKLVLWDSLKIDEENLELKPYLERKELLRLARFSDEDDVLSEPFCPPTTYADHYADDPNQTILYEHYSENLVDPWQNAITNNNEGIIIKDRQSAYEHRRTYSWLKVKNWRFETANVVGFTPGKNARRSFFGALVLADAQTGAFKGCAGSGFDDVELRLWKDHFFDCPPIQKPFTDVQVGESYTAIKSKQQVLVKYYQTTSSGVMRFPVYCQSTLSV